jgi:hypothetical protein
MSLDSRDPSATAGLTSLEATMPDSIVDIARRLAANAEAVCRHYLSNGRREGRYWLVGDVHNTPGRSLYVRLSGSASGDGTAGRWTEHVAAKVMLRVCDRGFSCWRSSASTHHNVTAWRGVS